MAEATTQVHRTGRKVKSYKLEVSYTIQAEMRDVFSDGSVDTYGSSTGERLSINDTFDLTDASSLTAVLHKIDAVHQVLRPE